MRYLDSSRPAPDRMAILLAVILLPAPAAASQLTDSGALFPRADYGTTEFGDFDLDGDLDLLLTGLAGSTEFSRIYRNDGASGWTDLGAALVPVRSGDAAWGDYDGDGDLDLVLTGLSSAAQSRIYRNDAGTFADSGAVLRGVYQSAAVWVDIDNDGDLDAALAGSTTDGGGSVTRFYRNDAGVFVEIDPAAPDLYRGSLDFGDGDGDGDLDLVVTGLIGTFTSHSEIYRNDGGEFTAIHAGLKNLFDGAARWADVDLDGDLDVVENGSDSTSTQVFTKLYRNDGGMAMAPIAVPIEGAGEGAALALGDYDADGDPDFAALAVRFNSTEVFRNDGGGSFPDAGESLATSCCGALAWGDVDADGDLDLVVGALFAGTKLYRNQETSPDSPPSPPTGLGSVVLPASVVLSWSPAADPETPSPGLTYNLRIGSTPGGSEVMPAESDPATGRRRVPADGNASHDLSWRLLGLPPGTYHWSVQAIDPGFEGSAFAPEATFVVSEPVGVGDDGGAGLAAQVDRLPWIGTEPGGDGVAVRYSVPGERPFVISLFDARGRHVHTLLRGTGPASRQTWHWRPPALARGVYFVELKSGGRSAACRWVWTK